MQARSPFKLNSVPVTFIGVMAILLLALGWLGWLLLDQDLSLNEQRKSERIDAAAIKLEKALANGLATELEKLNEITMTLAAGSEADLSDALDGLAIDTTFVHFSDDGMTILPGTDLRYLPITSQPESLPPTFEQADRLEFQQQDYTAAINLLKPLTDSSNPHIQAAALMRLGRINKRNGDINQALNSYKKLTELGGQSVSTIPAPWLGLYARCTIFEAEQQMAELGVELNRLVAALIAGGQNVSATSYRYYADAASGWASRIGKSATALPLSQAHAPSEMASSLFKTMNDWRQGSTASSGIKLGQISSDRVLGIWTTLNSDFVASIISLHDFHIATLAGVTGSMDSQGIGWAISTATGQILLSSGLEPDNSSSLRSLIVGDLAFTVTAFATPALLSDQNDINRRRLLLIGLFLILAIIVASTYIITRSLRREAEISRLQSDFVAAVSHEFRTPLTSIRQLTELLAAGRVQNKEKEQAYYRILENETARLQRLVEGLLDFGRMEAGVHPYQPETLSCTELLDEIVIAFREEYDLTADALSLEIKGTPYVYMDKEALTRAIWNLLDNAVKYSPQTPVIEVKAELGNKQVYITVADHGVGIPADEQADIFSKFVRGSAAELTNTKGTGMGLAMVRKIIQDQGGSINVRDNPGGGSVFTIVMAATEPQ